MDFQNVDVGEPVSDVAYLLILEMAPAQRREHEDRNLCMYDLKADK